MSGIVTPFLIVVGAWIGAGLLFCTAWAVARSGDREASDLHDPLSMQRQRRELYRRNTQEADETARFLRDQRAVTPPYYRNTKETS